MMADSSDNSPDRQALKDALRELFDKTDVFNDVTITAEGDMLDVVCRKDPYGLLITIRLRSDAAYVQAMTRQGIVRHKELDQPENDSVLTEVRRGLNELIPSYEE